MRQSEAIAYYSRPEVKKEIARVAENREVAIQFQGGVFGKRPQVIQFPQEIESFAREGATSFHISLERWEDPLKLNPDINRRQMDSLRGGWDMVVDIDCPNFEYSTLAADVLVQAFKFHDVTPSVKFSGNRGWHIAIPFEAFPKKVGKKVVSDLFPEGAAAIVKYIRDFLRERLIEEVKQRQMDIKEIAKKVGKEKKDFVKDGELDVFALIDLDIQVASPRHMIRAPYSIHEKTGLVSLPIQVKDISKFKKEQAKPENVKEINTTFFNPRYTTSGRATQLLVQALDFAELEREAQSQEFKEFKEISEKQSKERFPPCIKKILEGLGDGRKRALFILLNFLRAVNWDWKEIEAEIWAWNQRNEKPLKTGYVRSQLNWHRRQRKKVPPPNCKADAYYRDFNVCLPDNFCKKIKNPLSYIRQGK